VSINNVSLQINGFMEEKSLKNVSSLPINMIEAVADKMNELLVQVAQDHEFSSKVDRTKVDGFLK
jgi:hypothetical protein